MYRTALVAATVVAAMSCTLTTAAADAGEGSPGCGDVILYSHRGDETAGNTENSMGALRKALDDGLGFETDLRATKDGKIVLMHDPTIDRTTTGTGVVAEMSASAVRASRLDDGSVVPYLATALKLLAGYPDATAMLELKADGLPDAALELVRQRIRHAGLRDRVTVFSYNRAKVLSFRRIASRMHTSLISDGNEASWEPDQFVRYGGANVYAEQRSADWIARAHEIDLPLVGRDAENTTSWAAAADAGVRGQILDDTAGYRTWCAGAQ